MPTETTILDFINYDCLSSIGIVHNQGEQRVADDEALADKVYDTAINQRP